STYLSAGDVRTGSITETERPRMIKVTFLLPMIISALFAQTDSLSLDLSGWVRVAMENSPNIAISSADLLSSSASLTSSESFLWPRLSFSSSASHSWSSIPDVSGGYTDTDNASWSMSASISQGHLTSGGSSWMRLYGSRHSLDASRIDMDQARLDLTMDVVEAYYGVIEDDQLLISQRRALDRSTEQLRRTEALYEIGGATNLELIQAEVQQSTDNLTLLQREQAVSNSYTILYQIAGVIGTEYRVNTNAVLQPVSISTAMNYSLDMSGNNAIASSTERIRAIEYSYEANKRAYWPSLSAAGSWNWSNDELDFEDFSNRDTWQASITLSWTLFDGFSRESIIQSSRASVLRQQASHEALLNSIKSSILTAQNNLISSIRTWELSLEVLNQANEKLRLSQMSYDLGSIPLLDLLDAQSNVTQAEASVESSRTSCLIAEARLLVLLGRTPRIGE
ncbi:MAG: TolC family protein, partial [Candidatus Aegiribacteria sp.]|nr:TolC family protein [Candidatus Aegiribacteria sp.]